MTEQTRAVFENPELLRQELGKFLDTSQRLKVEIYAAAAEKFFKAGMRPRLEFKPTWSWWGFFCTVWFLFYRKLNKEGLIYLAVCICLGWIPVLNFFIGLYVPIFGKYLVIKRFEKALDMNNEIVFTQMSGVAKWPIYVGIAVLIVFFFIVLIVIFLIMLRFFSL